MRVVLLTSTGFLETELFQYLSAHVIEHFPDAEVVAVQHTRPTPGRTLRRQLRKLRRLGPWHSLALVSSWPLQRWWGGRDHREAERLLSLSQRPARRPASDRLYTAPGLNTEATARLLESLKPDVQVQIGAGILRERIFSVPRLGTLNLHHGIAPSIRGMHSIYWSVYERRAEWLGATVHKIDPGLDTGLPLAYCRMAPADLARPVPELFAELTRQGVDALVTCLKRLARGEQWTEPIPAGEQVYRSTFTGWQMLALKWRRRNPLR